MPWETLWLSGYECEVWSQRAKIRIPTLLLTSRATLGRLLNLCGPRFPQLQTRDASSTYFLGLLWGWMWIDSVTSSRGKPWLAQTDGHNPIHLARVIELDLGTRTWLGQSDLQDWSLTMWPQMWGLELLEPFRFTSRKPAWEQSWHRE